MAILEIALMGQPILRQKAQPVPQDQIKTKEIQQLIDDMIETACKNPEEGLTTVGLAASQVGYSKRIFLAATPESTAKDPSFNVYINPKIEYLSDEILSIEESCLSTPGLFGVVQRCKEVKLTYLDREGQKRRKKFSDDSAIYIQHEYDHLDGVLWIDKVTDTKTIRYR